MRRTVFRSNNGRAAMLALAASLYFGAPPAGAATITVDCDAGNTIGGILSGVKPGDTVLVSGTCKEQVNIAPEVTRVTFDGQKKATIQHPGGPAASPHAVYVRAKEITFKGFTVTGGQDGIHLSGPASAVLDGNVVTKNSGRGIHIDKGSIARMLNNTVEQSGGIGIDVTGASYAYIGVFIPRVPALSPNTVRNNGGPGINIERTSGAWIVGNTISGNKEAGIAVHRNAQADVIANIINANGGDAINVSFNGGVNLLSEPRRDGPNQTAAGQPNGGAGIRCTMGGYVDGPLGSLAGTKGPKAFDGGCVDRVSSP
ncbi:MAG: right-handed parallel beta-helix repeat-containing protein [Proteobacteria bacterium]|nr:right-handed parallel beta-helix repeat-containing protein [Pseudomonadota bacterium]